MRSFTWLFMATTAAAAGCSGGGPGTLSESNQQGQTGSVSEGPAIPDERTPEVKDGGGRQPDVGVDAAGTSSGDGSASNKKPPGERCASDGDCAFDLCLRQDGATRGVCTMPCHELTDCPGGHTRWSECTDVPDLAALVCIPN